MAASSAPLQARQGWAARSSSTSPRRSGLDAAGQVLLGDERVRGFPACLDPDLTSAGGDVLAHHPVRHVGDILPIEEPVEDPLRSVSLLAECGGHGPVADAVLAL
jgi:hypothetical protein